MDLENYKLLDFDKSIYQTQETDLSETFKRISNALINKTLIRTGNTMFFFQEIEFYFFKKGHPDPFVHRNKQQLKFGQWYLHAAGLDICLGNSDNSGETETYFGILIRSVRNEGEKLPIYGPLKVCDVLIASYGDVFGGGYLQIEATKLDNGFKIDPGLPRIGLKDRPDQTTEQTLLLKEYKEKQYRFRVTELPLLCQELKRKKVKAV
jgi:hypothetical protein